LDLTSSCTPYPILSSPHYLILSYHKTTLPYPILSSHDTTLSFPIITPQYPILSCRHHTTLSYPIITPHYPILSYHHTTLPYPILSSPHYPTLPYPILSNHHATLPILSCSSYSAIHNSTHLFCCCRWSLYSHRLPLWHSSSCTETPQRIS
jgi:hypothetical protein